MKKGKESYADLLIDEFHRRRKKLFARCGDDLMKRLELIRQGQEQHPKKVIDRQKETGQ